VYGLKSSNGEFKLDPKGQVQFNEARIKKHFAEAIRQAGEGNWKKKYFAGNDFLSGAYAEYEHYIESTHGESRQSRFMQQMLYPPTLFCEALQG
jgi:hypothetical protein